MYSFAPLCRPRKERVYDMINPPARYCMAKDMFFFVVSRVTESSFFHCLGCLKIPLDHVHYYPPELFAVKKRFTGMNRIALCKCNLLSCHDYSYASASGSFARIDLLASYCGSALFIAVSW